MDGDVGMMRRALSLARQGPQVDPNPRVGAVIIDTSGDIAGEGYHAGAGTPHAEVVALAAAGSRAEGGTAYVTLEPCNHTGRTGPCVQTLIAAGIARVVFAQADPNPPAAGGAHSLRTAGVDVTGGLLTAEAEALNVPWTLAVTRGRPMVTWKFAATMDGYSAATDGTSRWITSPEARADVHVRRAACGAILVGTGTVLADDPQLTARRPDGSAQPVQPLRVVAGMRQVPADAQVLDEAAETLIMHTRDPGEVLAALQAREIRHVWLEGGPTLAAAFLQAGLVDEVLAYLAPALLGRGRSAVADLGVTTIGDTRRLEIREVARVGPDLRVTLAPGAPSSQPASLREVS